MDADHAIAAAIAAHAIGDIMPERRDDQDDGNRHLPIIIVHLRFNLQHYVPEHDDDSTRVFHSRAALSLAIEARSPFALRGVLSVLSPTAPRVIEGYDAIISSAVRGRRVATDDAACAALLRVMAAHAVPLPYTPAAGVCAPIATAVQAGLIACAGELFKAAGGERSAPAALHYAAAAVQPRMLDWLLRRSMAVARNTTVLVARVLLYTRVDVAAADVVDALQPLLWDVPDAGDALSRALCRQEDAPYVTGGMLPGPAAAVATMRMFAGMRAFPALQRCLLADEVIRDVASVLQTVRIIRSIALDETTVTGLYLPDPARISAQRRGMCSSVRYAAALDACDAQALHMQACQRPAVTAALPWYESVGTRGWSPTVAAWAWRRRTHALSIRSRALRVLRKQAMGAATSTLPGATASRRRGKT